ncbi:multiple epidermal growth factor-like domains protein 11 [Patiria miniata]|uniref:Uncharacterized protein n=1 Tax=Patiria miniata TaxID=46514 RepID=A0A914AXI7_PATMI|nr:multiple epidermal growth factor-like domains protein 11 [Patiria miniata]
MFAFAELVFLPLILLIPAHEANTDISCDGVCEHGQSHTTHDACQCLCSDGWQGDRCDEKCLDARGQQACRGYAGLCADKRYEEFLATNCAATCGFCEKYGPSSEGFVCDLDCGEPGGTLNTEDCVCECANGWRGRLCNEKCEDQSEKCSLWGKYQCSSPPVANLCPAMCGECAAFGPGSPGFVCRLDCVNGGTLIANDEECRCACAKGWEGSQCEIVCQNHYELCEPDDNQPNRGSYTKQQCSTDFVYDKCHLLCGRCEKFGPSSPGFECTLTCGNSGVLTNDDTGCFCTCAEGWEGVRCEDSCEDKRPGGCTKIAYACKRASYAAYMKKSCAKTCGFCDAGEKGFGEFFIVHGETPAKTEELTAVSHEGPGIEVAFLIDCSGSMRADADQHRAILRDYLTSLDYMAGGGLRVSLVTFGSGASVRLNLFDADSVPRVLRSLDEVRYEGGETNMKKAFQIARRLVLVHSRKKARKVIFVFTDGLFTGQSPVQLAAALRKEGVEMYALSFTEHYMPDNMEELVDDPAHVKVVTSASDLPALY